MMTLAILLRIRSLAYPIAVAPDEQAVMNVVLGPISESLDAM